MNVFGDGRGQWTSMAVVFSLLLVAAWGLFYKAPLLAAPDLASVAHLHFDPPIADLSANTSVTVTVQVTDVEKLFGLEFDILYDPERVTIESIAPGDFLSADFVVKRTIDSGQGVASLAYTQIAKEPRNGSGNVAVIVLRRTNCLFGTTLQLRNSILSNNDGIAIAHDTTDEIVQNLDTGDPRRLAGTIFHDSNANGIQDSGEQPLDGWPVFSQSFSSNLPNHFILSGANGRFQFDNLACGRHTVWSQNGTLPTPTQRISLPAASDVLSISLPITGSLIYPFQRVFIPVVERTLP